MSKVNTFFVAGLGNVCEFLKRNPWQQNTSRDALTTLYVPSLLSSQTPTDHMGCFEICVTGTCEGYPRDPYCLCCLRTTVIYVTHLKEYHSTICLAMRQSWRLGVQMIFICQTRFEISLGQLTQANIKSESLVFHRGCESKGVLGQPLHVHSISSSPYNVSRGRDTDGGGPWDKLQSSKPSPAGWWGYILFSVSLYWKWRIFPLAAGEMTVMVGLFHKIFLRFIHIDPLTAKQVFLS